jgi:hypothetical protein
MEIVNGVAMSRDVAPKFVPDEVATTVEPLARTALQLRLAGRLNVDQVMPSVDLAATADKFATATKCELPQVMLSQLFAFGIAL